MKANTNNLHVEKYGKVTRQKSTQQGNRMAVVVASMTEVAATAMVRIAVAVATLVEAVPNMGVSEVEAEVEEVGVEEEEEVVGVVVEEEEEEEVVVVVVVEEEEEEVEEVVVEEEEEVEEVAAVAAAATAVVASELAGAAATPETAVSVLAAWPNMMHLLLIGVVYNGSRSKCFFIIRLSHKLILV
jgi:hypothetical protein